MTEGRGQKAEVREQRTDVRGQKAEDRGHVIQKKITTERHGKSRKI